MAVFTKIYLKVADKEILHVQSIELQQEMLAHHQLSVKIRRDHLEQENDAIFRETQNLIGEGIKLVIESDYTDKHELKLEFIGIIHKIKTIRSNKSYGDLIQIFASSPDIQMSDIPDFQSFENKSLDSIVSEVINRYNIRKKEINSKPNHTSHYIVQFNENGFDFLKRLAIKYGQWFFYDGQTLFFGKIPKRTVKLEYGRDLFQLDFSMKISSFAYEYATQDYRENKSESIDAKTAERYIPKQSKPAFDKSNKLFQQKSQHFYFGSLNNLHNQELLRETTNLSKSATVSNLLFCEGVSDDPGISLGATIEITEEVVEANGKQNINHGKYIVTEASHNCDANGNYKNTFKAVPIDIEVPPYTNPELFQQAEPHSAIVVENEDPEGMSRIRVQHFWQQANKQKTPWLRIITPYGGADKGIHFIPEIGEEVLVGFVGGNIERPYINGSLFHGKAKPDKRWTGKNNDFKTIRTRSGHTIEFIDKKGQEEIKIYDGEPDQFTYSITLATHSKEILIESKGDLEIKAKNIRITADKNFELQANNISQNADSNMELSASNKVGMKAGSKMNLDGGAQLEQKASAKMSINGGGNMNLKAGIVKIN